MIYDLNELNNEYAFPDQIIFGEGKGKLPVVTITTAKARAVISLLGGQVISFQPADATQDLLFVSDRAYFKVGKSIKGGIPVCWPWFAEAPEGLTANMSPFHGFARTAPWGVIATGVHQNGNAEVVLRLHDSELTRTIWPYSFELEQRIHIGDVLSLELSTRNTGASPFQITQAAHTYFSIGDISGIRIYGLDGVSYLDKVDSFRRKKQQGPVTIDREVDRIYQKVRAPLMIHDPSFQRGIEIESQGSETAVVWNPWIKISAESEDLADDDYRRFVCVETANAADEVIRIEPGAQHTMAVTYRIRAVS